MKRLDQELKYLKEMNLEPQLAVLNCLHEYIDGNGNCTQCGKFHQQIYGLDRPTISNGKGSEKSIMKDMQNMALPDEIKIRAEEIFGRLNCATKRGNRRKQLVFFCVHNAYIEFGDPQDPKTLAEIVDIKPSEMTKAFSTFSEAQTGYKPQIIQITAIDLLPQYCEKLNFLPEMVEETIAFARRILEIDPELNETYPQKVASGILYYYAETHGMLMSKREYARMMKLSEVTITNMYKYIAKIDNDN
jgi:transcription initiation factor TFIIIB Brf1 subunit/transcription initiation factor TFIIB